MSAVGKTILSHPSKVYSFNRTDKKYEYFLGEGCNVMAEDITSSIWLIADYGLLTIEEQPNR